MASKDHQALADFIKQVHTSLRQLSHEIGDKEAWAKHCQKKDTLEKYANCMSKLATQYWDVNVKKTNSTVTSRIQWAADQCDNYFLKDGFLKYRQRDIDIGNKIDISIDTNELPVSFKTPLEVIDVGSCYNPFKLYSFMNVFAIDLHPANEEVLQCDFLLVPLALETEVTKKTVRSLKKATFHVVLFCFLLEYIPTSNLRIEACQKAYELLRPEGLLIICTPDSKHVGANSRIMKCWQYTLAMLGYTRIKYEKFSHMHSMVFRKSLHKEVAVRWATLHKKPYMDFELKIPQDVDSNL